MNRALNWTGQALLYGSFALVVGVFSRWPSCHPVAPNEAQIKVSFIHHGARIAECRPYTAEELGKLAPNMRAPMKCERERSPVRIEVEIDGVSVFAHTAIPSGFSRDGASTVYQRLNVPAGEHRITVRMKDNMKSSDFSYVHDSTVTLQPAQVMVIDFNPDKGEIVLL